MEVGASFWEMCMIFRQKYKLKNYACFALLIVVVGIMISSIEVEQNQPRAAQDEISNYNEDQLLYVDENFGGSGVPTLLLYEPVTSEHTLLIENFSPEATLWVDGNGRFAYVLEEAGNQDIYVMDVYADPISVVNITQTPDTMKFIMGWNQNGTVLAYRSGELNESASLYVWDGEQIVLIDHGDVWGDEFYEHLLAYSKQDEDGAQLFVWDGERSINVTPHNMAAEALYLEGSWSYDGQLAIVAVYREHEYLEPNGYSEVFLWDGQQTVKVPNPTQDEEFTFSGWSADGQLALRTKQDYVSKLFIWDGVSLTDDRVPDVASFVYVSNGFSFIRHAVWTTDNQLLFNAEPSDRPGEQYYLWDGERAVNVSKTPGLHTFGATWSHDGRWMFTSDFHEAGSKSVHVRDANNESVATLPSPGYGAPLWGTNGHVAFCQLAELVVWDGDTITTVASGFAVPGTWLIEGGHILCSVG